MPDEMLVDYADYKLDSTEESAFDNDQGADLAALTSDAESRKPTDIEPTANNEAIDFDLSSLSFDSRVEHAKDTDQDLELETFNFNFDLDEIGVSEQGPHLRLRMRRRHEQEEAAAARAT